MDLCLAASQLPLAREPRLVLVQILHGSIINNYKNGQAKSGQRKRKNKKGAVRMVNRACDYHSSAASDTGLSSDNKYRTFSRHTPYDDVHKKSA